MYWLALASAAGSWPRFLGVAEEGAGVAGEMSVVSDQCARLSDLEYHMTECGCNHPGYFCNNTPRELRFTVKPRFLSSEMIDRRDEK